MKTDAPSTTSNTVGVTAAAGATVSAGASISAMASTGAAAPARTVPQGEPVATPTPATTTASARLAFTCGDPAGVGPEIIAAWLAHHDHTGITAIGAASWLAQLPTSVARLAVGPRDYTAVAGRPDSEGARVALAALEAAAAGTQRGDFAAVVSGPVSKAALAAVGFPYPGQTEFFAARWGGEPVMAFCGGRLRVVLLTWHIPLHTVPRHLTYAAFARTVAAAAQLARAEGRTAPRIGVCGLNPHAGEGGLLGTEEIEVIAPILDQLRPAYSGLSGPEPGDTLFARALRDEFDVVIALYHDQGLAPLKTVDFDEAVNVTLGLPFLRTSPDHGTAFGLAGRGLARGTSFAQAVNVARRLLQARVA